MITFQPVLLFFLVVCTRATPLEPRIDDPYRLPTGAVEAIHYDIKLRLATNVFDVDTFEGDTIVIFKNLLATSEIKIHANKLTIATVELVTQDGNPIQLQTTVFESDNVTDFLTLITATPLTGGSDYALRFTYTGVLRTDEMYGFYKSYYFTSGGVRRYLGTTQFQPTHARKVFPCFDEPSYKAEFDIRIRHAAGLTAVGNTRGSRVPDANDANYVTTIFGITPKMSTYLVAFVVSDFTCTDSDNAIAENVPHTVCSRADTAEHRQTALEAGPQLVWAMENFTNIKYTASGMNKMHEFAIPDFSAGAMENWALLTYRETGLLWDPAQSSNSYRQRLENVVSHEVAHMWFGNLVTCHWWSDTFLNEGFARYFQYFATAKIEPTWELEKQFVVEQVQSILASDAQPTAAALSSPASSPSQVSGRFASVSYNKGASIFRKLITVVMGEEPFKLGINTYLTTFMFGTTTPADLWTHLQPHAEGKLPPQTTLAQVMDNWVNKPGFPVLTVNNIGNNVTIAQQRFLVSGTPGADEKWYVPISYTLSTDTNKFEDTTYKNWLLPNADLTISNVLTGENPWIILNNQQTAYYRVNYAETLWNRISTALNAADFSGIHELNRAQLVDDMYNLAKVDIHPYSKVFNFFNFLKQDTSYYPWYSAYNAFSDMLQRTENTRIRSSLSNYILGLIDTLYKSVPFDQPNDANQIYTLNRVQAITLACRLGHQGCVTSAVAAFQNYKTTNAVDKNLKGVVYCNGLRHSGDAQNDWNFLWDKYQASNLLATEQITILSALGCSTNRDVLLGYLARSIDASSGIRQQDAASVFSAVYSQNPVGVDIAFDFLLDNYQAISDYYGTMNSLNSMFSGLAARFTNQGQIDKLRLFLETATDLSESLQSAAESAATNAEANLKWTAEFERQLIQHFNLGTGTADSLKIGLTTMLMTTFMVCYQLLH